MKFKYEIGVRVPMRNFITPVKEMEDSVNENMGAFGFSEKMVVTSVIPLELTVEKRPTESEFYGLRTIIQENCAKAFGSATIEYMKEV